VTSLNIVLVDDKEDVQTLVDDINLLQAGASAELSAPDAVTAEELRKADLVLLDYDISGWTPALKVPDLQRPQDGLGFASVVRSYFRAENHHGAVALLSDKLDQLAKGLTVDASEQAVARLHNLEWAFPKSEPEVPPPLAERIIGLARASRNARQIWPNATHRDPKCLESFLDFDGATPWSAHGRVMLNAAQPPVADLAAVSRGQAVLRWLAQRVLPYPGLLIDAAHTCVMLGLDPAGLDAPGDGSRELRDRLAPYCYSGVLADFTSPRWWKAGVQHLVAELSDGRPRIDAEGMEKFRAEFDNPPDPIGPDLVVTLDEKLQQSGQTTPRRSAVRLRPDDWPIFADPAFVPATMFAIDDDELRQTLLTLIDPADKPLVGPADGT
jgi:hypothetical protein